MPLSVEPVGGMSLMIAGVANTFAVTQAWQDWCGALTAEEAIDRIHFYALPKPESENGYTTAELDALRPAIGLTYIPPSFARQGTDSYTRDRNAHESFTEKGMVYAHIVDQVEDSSVQTASLIMAFTNKLGVLIDDLLLTGDSEGTSYLRAIGVIREPMRVNELHINTKGDFIDAMLRIEVGVG